MGTVTTPYHHPCDLDQRWKGNTDCYWQKVQKLGSVGLYQCLWQRSFILLCQQDEYRKVCWDFGAAYDIFTMTSFPEMPEMYFSTILPAVLTCPQWRMYAELLNFFVTITKSNAAHLHVCKKNVTKSERKPPFNRLSVLLYFILLLFTHLAALKWIDGCFLTNNMWFKGEYPKCCEEKEKEKVNVRITGEGLHMQLDLEKKNKKK